MINKVQYSLGKWDEIKQINSNTGNIVQWCYFKHHPTPYNKTKGLGLNASEWHYIAKWNIKYKTRWQIIKTKIKKMIINDN